MLNTREELTGLIEESMTIHDWPTADSVVTRSSPPPKKKGHVSALLGGLFSS